MPMAGTQNNTTTSTRRGLFSGSAALLIASVSLPRATGVDATLLDLCAEMKRLDDAEDHLAAIGIDLASQADFEATNARWVELREAISDLSARTPAGLRAKAERVHRWMQMDDDYLDDPEMRFILSAINDLMAGVAV